MLTGRPTSVWNANVPVTDHPQLSGEVDVAVVGGGIAGVTTALLLKLSGVAEQVEVIRQTAHFLAHGHFARPPPPEA